MKKFRFRFDTVLNVRRTKEGETLRGLAAAQRMHQLEVMRKNALLETLAQSLLRREGLGVQAVGPEMFALEQDFIVGTKQRIIQADHAIARAGRGVEKALRAYLYARRQTKMIETLYDKDYSQYRRDAAKAEQKSLDDLMIMRNRLKHQEEESA
ncbi:MAG: flagellar export protein FliJ [Bdellovibrionota bacterium]